MIERAQLASARRRVLFFALTALLTACSTIETPPDPPAAAPPPIISMPHPAGADLADIRDLFFDKQAPLLDSLKSCDADFRNLQKVTQARDVLSEGMRELVRKDPAHYHWCFYAKILALEASLKGELYVDERQKRVLDAFDFLVPLARVFLSDYRDSRYLRWAIARYQKLSEWVFFRRVEPSPKETEELVNAANPLGLVRGAGDDSNSVLDRYHLSTGAGASDSAAPAAASENPPTTSTGLSMGQMPGDSPRAPAATAPSGEAPMEPLPADAEFKPFSAIDPAQQAAPATAPAPTKGAAAKATPAGN